MDAFQLYQNARSIVVLRSLKRAVRSLIQEGNWENHTSQVHAFAAH